MCGRFGSFAEWSELQDKFAVTELDDAVRPSYNIAPTQRAPVILDAAPSRVSAVQWGLVPSWSKEPKMAFSMINARAETLGEKPAYKHLVQRRRCVIIASGFYEWHTKGKVKQPYFLQYRDGVFGMAGLWDEWHSPDGKTVLRTFTIITTSPNELMQPIHDRMPVMLTPAQCKAWLVTGDTGLLHAFPASLMTATRVSPLVNNVRNNNPDVLRPLNA
ncbi:MAG TPA: SOS response-associated peptidase [Bryobacteraceae bacterium]|jgi:putative SOS response-associated peptidase YedK